MKSFLKRYALTLCCIFLIWYLCLFKPPSISLGKVEGIDKVVHFLMYFGLCLVMWTEYMRCHHRLQFRRLALAAVVAPIAMSGVIELVQNYCTTTRSGEWADFAANSLGVVLAAIVALTVLRRFIHPQASSL